MLDFMFFAGMLVTVSLPWSVRWIGERFDYNIFVEQYREVVVIYFILGILAILIIGELRKIFRTVLAEDCFVKDNVVSLQRMGTYSLLIALLCAIRACIHFTLAIAVVILVFIIAGLFSKVLSSVFDKAVTYKLENDLTI